MNFKYLFTTLICLLLLNNIYSQDTAAAKLPPPPKKWYENIHIRGYGQLRYNRLLETNEDLKCEQCDRAWGKNGGVSFRRLRMIFFGQIHERLYFYIQTDFANAAGTVQHLVQIRDAYFDVSLDKKREFRFRLGQSKVPFGFENLQSSQNRMPLDRTDAINSALSNERDLGAFFYWAPAKTRELFSTLVSSGLKGSGDYGVLGVGMFNGQTGNKLEANNTPHIVARASYPFQIKKQIIEPGLQAYSGKVVVNTLTSGVKGQNSKFEYDDQRVAGSVVLYPKPIGFQAEYNVGTGPRYNPATDSIEQSSLHGGYVMLTCLLNLKKGHVLLPYVRGQYYDGGKKHELDARSHTVKELEVGVEWQAFKNFETTVAYTFSDRKFEDKALPNNHQKGRLLRIQLQFNF